MNCLVLKSNREIDSKNLEHFGYIRLAVNPNQDITMNFGANGVKARYVANVLDDTSGFYDKSYTSRIGYETVVNYEMFLRSGSGGILFVEKRNVVNLVVTNQAVDIVDSFESISGCVNLKVLSLGNKCTVTGNLNSLGNCKLLYFLSINGGNIKGDIYSLKDNLALSALNVNWTEDNIRGDINELVEYWKKHGKSGNCKINILGTKIIYNNEIGGADFNTVEINFD